MAAATCLMLWAGLWAFFSFEGKVAFAGAILTPVMLFALAFCVRYLADNQIAKIGHNSLEFFGLLGSKTIRYDQITSIDIETTSVNFISQRHLVIKSADQSLGRARIAEMMLEKRAGMLEGILDAITNAPDEALAPQARPARRMERGNTPNASSPAPQRARGFGRKMV
ncbi:hypothetical protein [uncultured Erythrobacter sp.]|nr:hypothetical protein [uncultured Erythrobacter sp.]